MCFDIAKNNILENYEIFTHRKIQKCSPCITGGEILILYYTVKRSWTIIYVLVYMYHLLNICIISNEIPIIILCVDLDAARSSTFY